MRSLASLHKSRAYGPQNFCALVQSDFCNTIGTKQTFSDVRHNVAIGDRTDNADHSRN